jgi:ATP-dependent DNA helicase RecG
VERSGQGMNRIFEACIRESKPKPDFTHTDAYHVWLTLHGEIQHPEFLRFLEKLGNERLESFTKQDLLVIDNVFRDEPVSDCFRENLLRLVDSGVIEQISRGRGTRYVLSRRFYEFIGKKGTYTRKKGLDRETNKMLLLKHIKDNHKEGSPLGELMQVLPMFSRRQVQRLLEELEAEGEIRGKGKTRAGLWYSTEFAPEE